MRRAEGDQAYLEGWRRVVRELGGAGPLSLTLNLFPPHCVRIFFGKNWKIPRFRGSTNPHYLAMIFHDKYLTWRCHIDETSCNVFL